MKTLNINECFYSLQGEGARAGMPAVFLRLAGCNLRCEFCDTKYAYDQGQELTTEKAVCLIHSKAQAVNPPVCRNVIITGGEPAIQMDGLMDLVRRLRGWKPAWNIGIETNGTIDISGLGLDWITVSPKPPAPLIQRTGHELKVLFFPELERRIGIEIIRSTTEFLYHFIQPVSMKNVEAVVLYIKKHPHWRLSLQWQKLIGIK